MNISEAISFAEAGETDKVSWPSTMSEIHPSDTIDALRLAVLMKVAGQRDWCLEFLKIFTEKHPHEGAARYEYGVLLQESKRLLDALIQAKAAYEEYTTSFRFSIFYAHMLSANGAWREADKILNSVKADSETERAELLSMQDFNRYLQETPRQKAAYVTRNLREKYHWMNQFEVAASIEIAVRERKPFSLIRLGDGDGAHFSVNAEDEAKYPHLHKRVRKQHTDFLLGIDNDPVFTGYTALTTTLMRYVKEADLLGVPYPTWIEHEYDISSPVTLTCLMNVNRHLYENERVQGLTLCDQMIHAELHHDKLVEPIMKKLDALTVISCLDELPAKIKELFGIKDVDLIKIPSETYAPHLYGERHLKISNHFPHAFWPTVQELSRPHNGRVFLIAAGTFGKYYATIIKRNGGIALDLGSLVDGWMKLASRPGYAEMFA